MRFWDFLGGSKRLKILHCHSETIYLDAIDNDVDFIRENYGLTVIEGAVGHNVTLHIRQGASLRIIGNIGRSCKIIKEDDGALTIEGTVADDLKIVAYGQGSITFTQRPSEFVIRAIKNPLGTPIICAGVPLPTPTQRYMHHNTGIGPEYPQRERVSSPRLASGLGNPHIPNQLANPSHSSSPANVKNEYSNYTLIYITRDKNNKKIATRIAELNLTEEEIPLFESFKDPITMEYFDDTPVMYHDVYYNLSTLLTYKRDPQSREPLEFIHIESGRRLLNDFENAINLLLISRESAKLMRDGPQEGDGVNQHPFK